MSPNTRTGLLAFAIVLGGLLVLGTAVLVVVAVRKNVESGGSLASIPKDERTVMEHKWWTRSATKADLDRIVQHIIDTPSTHFVCVSRDLETTNLHRVHTSFPAEFVIPNKDPKDLGTRFKKYFTIKMTTDKRPTRSEVITSLSAALDTAEYRDGAGR